MPSQNESDPELEPMDLKVFMEVVSADILGLKRYQDIVRKLLASPPGVWQPLREFHPTDDFSPRYKGCSREFGEKALEGLHLTWTLQADEPADSPYFFILFYYGRDDLMWHSLAIYNREAMS